MNIFKKSAVIAGALALGLTLASCSGGTTDTTEPDSTVTQPSASPENTTTPDATEPGDSTGFAKLAPVIINPADLTEGQVVEVMEGNGIDLTVDGDPAAWKGESSDPSVAEFSPGGVSGEATFNPGVYALSAGESTITLTDGETGGTVITFVVSVTPSTIPDGAVA